MSYILWWVVMAIKLYYTYITTTGCLHITHTSFGWRIPYEVAIKNIKVYEVQICLLGCSGVLNNCRPLFYTAVHPRRQIWTSYSPPWELEISHQSLCATLNMFLISMRWDYVSELWPPTGLLFAPHTIYEYGELRWNDIDRRDPKNSEKTLSQCHSVHHKSKLDWPGYAPGCERSANNRLSHGTALFKTNSTKQSLLEKLIVAQLVNKFPTFVEPGALLPYSQHAIGFILYMER
jgi:hypothetical protein